MQDIVDPVWQPRTQDMQDIVKSWFYKGPHHYSWGCGSNSQTLTEAAIDEVQRATQHVYNLGHAPPRSEHNSDGKFHFVRDSFWELGLQHPVGRAIRRYELRRALIGLSTTALCILAWYCMYPLHPDSRVRLPDGCCPQSCEVCVVSFDYPTHKFYDLRYAVIISTCVMYFWPLLKLGIADVLMCGLLLCVTCATPCRQSAGAQPLSRMWMMTCSECHSSFRRVRGYSSQQPTFPNTCLLIKFMYLGCSYRGCGDSQGYGRRDRGNWNPGVMLCQYIRPSMACVWLFLVWSCHSALSGPFMPCDRPPIPLPSCVEAAAVAQVQLESTMHNIVDRLNVYVTSFLVWLSLTLVCWLWRHCDPYHLPLSAAVVSGGDCFEMDPYDPEAVQYRRTRELLLASVDTSGAVETGSGGGNATVGADGRVWAHPVYADVVSSSQLELAVSSSEPAAMPMQPLPSLPPGDMGHGSAFDQYQAGHVGIAAVARSGVVWQSALSSAPAGHIERQAASSSQEPPPCSLLCGEQGVYSLTAGLCPHYLCAECLPKVVDAILSSGQFPALCPGCRSARVEEHGYGGEDGGDVHKKLCAEPSAPVLADLSRCSPPKNSVERGPEVGVIDAGVMCELLRRGVLRKPRVERFIKQSLLHSARRRARVEEEEEEDGKVSASALIECPNCTMMYFVNERDYWLSREPVEASYPGVPMAGAQEDMKQSGPGHGHEAEAAVECPQGHSLQARSLIVRSSSRNLSQHAVDRMLRHYACAACGNAPPEHQGTLWHMCMYCDYDLCPACVSSRLKERVACPVPSAPAQADANLQKLASAPVLLSVAADDEVRSSDAHRLRAECLNCRFAFCLRCNVQWHVGMTCTRYQAGLQQALRVGDDSTLLLKATTKPCPGCGYLTSKYRGHACHHIAPGTGCPGCGTHWCFNCSGAWPCKNKCGVFCDSRCKCVTCPDCTRDQHCQDCDGPGGVCVPLR